MKVTDLLQNLVHIYESPQVVDDGDWGLGTTEQNAKVLKDLMSAPGTREIGNYRGLKLYRLRGVIFAATNLAGVDTLVYRVKTDVTKIGVVGENAITQRELWRNADISKTSGLANYVFFNIWLKEYKLVASDHLQTRDGKKFWVNRVAEAFKKGEHVYIAIEHAPRKLIKVIDMDEFDELVSSGHIWSTDPKYRLRRILISDHLLTSRKDVELDD